MNPPIRLRVAVTAVFFASMFAADSSPRAVQVTEKNYKVYRGDGTPCSLNDVFEAAGKAVVTFVGEEHDDPVAHYLELEVLKAVPAARTVLAMEMFERDVQNVVDEYLNGIITEEHLIASGRAWPGYKTAYRPLVEHAKENHIRVIASNAPRRSVNRVSRLGKESLSALSDQAKATIAPLPYADASAEYAENFRRVMEEVRKQQPPEKTPRDPRFGLQAQSLWDATMAYTIAESLIRNPDSHLLHINGSFHSEHRLGILDHLQRYRPNTATVVVTVTPRDDFPKWSSKLANTGDFVIVTDASLEKKSSSPAPKR